MVRQVDFSRETKQFPGSDTASSDILKGWKRTLVLVEKRDGPSACCFTRGPGYSFSYMDDAIMAFEHVKNIRQGNERYLRMTLQFSARNQLRARVKSVKLGTVMAEVIVELSDGQQIVSAITGTSAEELNLQAGDDVLVIIKSTEVMIGKDV